MKTFSLFLLIMCLLVVDTSYADTSNTSQYCANARKWHYGAIERKSEFIQSGDRSGWYSVKTQTVSCAGGNTCTLKKYVNNLNSAACYQGACVIYQGSFGNNLGLKGCALAYQHKWGVFGYPPTSNAGQTIENTIIAVLSVVSEGASQADIQP